MKYLAFITLCLLFLTSCSSKPTAPTAAVEVPGNQPQVFIDPEQPLSYEQYKEWRKVNDPQSQAYANYKTWIINYRRWKQQQEQ